jgi:hypothetical protein
MTIVDKADLQAQVDAFLIRRKGGERLIALLSLPALGAGMIYATAEYYTFGVAQDAIFVVLLCLATMVLTGSVFYIRRHLVASAALIFEAALPSTYDIPSPSRTVLWRVGASGPGQLLDAVFDRSAMAASGAVYGMLLGSVPYVLGVLATRPNLQAALALFMFCANTVTGAVLYSICVVLRQSWHLADRLKVSFFERRSDAVVAYTALLARTSIFAALYIGLCQVSVIFSRFSGLWVYLYAIFAAGIFLGIYYVPQAPIAARIRRERDFVLNKIDAARASLARGEFSADAIDRLTKLQQIEAQVLLLPLGLSPANALMVSSQHP